MNFFAHTSSLPSSETSNPDKSTWEPLITPFGTPHKDDSSRACSGEHTNCPHCENLAPYHGHLNKVAHLTARFLGQMASDHPETQVLRKWGYLTGLWHDLGKFAPKWQNYLATKADPHLAEVAEKMDHTSAGAKHAVETSPSGHLMATAIAGHHAGLLDARSENASLEKRLHKIHGEDLPKITPPAFVTDQKIPPFPSFLKGPSPAFSLSFFQRMLFSSLVDADFLATEAFMNPDQAKLRPTTKDSFLENALTLLEEKYASFLPTPSDSLIAKSRTQVVADCTAAAPKAPGLFSLTVPTGGGKTLSSLNFALRHALAHGHQRIIYVIPFTSIIEQNAAVFRDLLSPLGENVVLEHHSNLSPDSETTTSRLASENWDAPLIVTTAVQFYESLYAAKTSRSRKLHNIANAVVILDEAQCLPVQYLQPCLRVLEELYRNYRSTVVLCTATQPAVTKSPDFPIGTLSPTEIIQDPEKLFIDLARVKVKQRGPLSDPTLVEELASTPQVLCIVNTRKHAHQLFASLPPPEENFHLSTLMCPEHRLKILSTVRQRLQDRLPVRLISTQLIEAGVDIDFPIVYRSRAGLDSIAQAAGRCNREGQLDCGSVHVFQSEHTSSERFIAETTNVGHEFLDLYIDDPLGITAVQAYFKKYYYQQKDQWDQKNILENFTYPGDKELPFLFDYRKAADAFRLIESAQISIIIPWNDEAKALCEELRNEFKPLNRNLFRRLQRYTVQIYQNEFFEYRHQFDNVRDDQFRILTCPETHYSNNLGLHLNEHSINATSLVCS